MNLIPFFLMYFFVYEATLNFHSNKYYLLFKSLASICFLICAFLSYKKSPSTKKYSRIIITSLFFGLLGDVFLALKFSNAFLLGASAFTIGHILFIIGFSTISPLHLREFIISILVAAAFIFFTSHNSNFNLQDKSLIVAIYTLIILTMTLKAIDLLKLRKSNSFFIYFTVLGASLFFISDIILSLYYFLNNAPEYLNPINLIIYYTGQGLIALSLSDTSLTSSNSCSYTRNN